MYVLSSYRYFNKILLKKFKLQYTFKWHEIITTLWTLLSCDTLYILQNGFTRDFATNYNEQQHIIHHYYIRYTYTLYTNGNCLNSFLVVIN